MDSATHWSTQNMPALRTIWEKATMNQRMRCTFFEIKTLYFKRQFRQCVQLCEQFLSCSETTNPVSMTYTNFYSALSYEGLARAMSNYATNKLSTLELAESYYIAALRSLASANAFSGKPIPSLMSQDSIFETLTHLDHSQSPYYVTTNESRPKSTSSTSSMATTVDGACLSQSSRASSACSSDWEPIKLGWEGTPGAQRFSQGDGSSTTSVESGRTPSPLSLKSRIVPAVLPVCRNVETASPPASPTSPGSTEDWLLARSKAKYTLHLGTLRDQLEYHIRAVQTLKEAASNTQQRKRLTSAPASYWVLPTGTMSEEDKAERVREGRARGWERKNVFGEKGAERIQMLCERALTEL